MNILFTLNNGFVPQVATCICSILENNKFSKKIKFYLVSDGISDINKNLLKNFVSSYGQQIYFIELGNIKNYLDFTVDTNGWHPIVLARLFLDKLLPDDIERVLYLDGDTLVLDDLEELFETNLFGNVIGMSPEPTVDKQRKLDLKLNNRLYCNAGVLLIDLKKWRDENIGKQVLSFYEKHKGRLFANDQDALNGALREQVYVLSIRYNFFNIYWSYPYHVLKKLTKPIDFMSEQNYHLALNNPVIIHFLGEERPWRRGNHHKFSNQYHRYLSKTPWKDTEMETGWEFYFKCFYLFNNVTRFFPMLRYKIINSLIPAMMSYRKRQLKKK
ncbi:MULTISPECIES: glycosyltransferase family 8 protein [unclassified Streptococcus]|uniref:glycosyltransferase family 8 protein n=1 Tax=unclassified Streptococcus TaxID=2608887 RepID=UPI00359E6E2D